MIKSTNRNFVSFHSFALRLSNLNFNHKSLSVDFPHVNQILTNFFGGFFLFFLFVILKGSRKKMRKALFVIQYLSFSGTKALMSKVNAHCLAPSPLRCIIFCQTQVINFLSRSLVEANSISFLRVSHYLKNRKIRKNSFQRWKKCCAWT